MSGTTAHRPAAPPRHQCSDAPHPYASLSYLSAQYGLACDGFVQLDVVLADGSLVAARADNEYADLFKALKGGGNRFGVVTGYHVKVSEIQLSSRQGQSD